MSHPLRDAILAETVLPDLLKDYLSDPNNPATAPAHDAAFVEVNRLVHQDPEKCWRFLELAAASELGDLEAAYIAAGPLEDLLGQHGARLRQRVEETAHRDPGMRRMLGGVWKGRMSNEDWAWFTGLRERLSVRPL